MSITVRVILQRASRLNGALAMGDDLTAPEAESLLQAYNNMTRGFHGTIIGTPLTPVSLTATMSAETGGSYMCFISAAANLTLPANPKGGARVGFADVKNNFATYNLTVKPNGRLIEGAASDLTISTSLSNRVYWFNPETGNWVKEVDAAIDDTCVYPDAISGFLPDMLAVYAIGEYGGEVRPEVAARAVEGRAAFARVLGRKGRNQAFAPMAPAT